MSVVEDKVEEHFNKHRDVPLALATVKSKAWTDMLRGKHTRYAYKQLKSWQDAEDAVQEAYTRVLEQVGKGKEIRNLEGYFIIVLRSCIANVFNVNRNKPESDSCEGSEDYNIPEDQKEYLEDHFIRLSEIKNIQRISRQLPVHYQDIYTLKFVYEHSYEEIQEVLGVSRHVIKKAVTKLNKRLKEEEDE